MNVLYVYLADKEWAVGAVPVAGDLPLEVEAVGGREGEGGADQAGAAGRRTLVPTTIRHTLTVLSITVYGNFCLTMTIIAMF